MAKYHRKYVELIHYSINKQPRVVITAIGRTIGSSRWRYSKTTDYSIMSIGADSGGMRGIDPPLLFQWMKTHQAFPSL